MNDLYRLVDANLNRVSEGLRVLEDLARLQLEDGPLCAELRAFRHRVRQGAKHLAAPCLTARAAESDVGLAVSKESRSDARLSLRALVAANFKRVQEGLRVLEESLKLLGHYPLAKQYEDLRFCAYSLESRYVSLLAPERATLLPETDLYGMTAEKYSRGRDNVQVAGEMLAAGIRIIQYREKEKDSGDIYRECREIRRLTREEGATFIVNDHPELALMVEADGVHLGQDDYPIEAVRALVGPKMLIGLSTHSPQQATDAATRGADYIGVGPLYSTLTKERPTPAVGLEYLDYVVANIKVPFVALGGVKLSNVAEVRRRGARLVAMASGIVGAADIGERVREIRAAIQEEEVMTV